MPTLVGMSGRPRKLGRRAGIRLRTTVVAVTAVTLSVAGAVAILLVRLDQGLDSSATAEVIDTARQVAEQITEDRPTDPELVAALGSRGAVITQVVTADGQVVAASPEAKRWPPLGTARPALGRQVVSTETEVFDPAGDDYRVVAVGARGRYGAVTVYSGRSLAFVDATVSRVAVLVGLGFGALLLVAGFVVYRSVGAVLRPVEVMRVEVARISSRDLDRRVLQPPGRDEISRLAATLNEMLDRLASAQTAQRRFVSDASHELRSPLSTIGAALDVAELHPGQMATAELVALVRGQTGRLEHLVDDLLLLARTDDATDRLRRTEVDLDDVVVGEARRLAATSELEVTVAVQPVKVLGDPDRLRRAVANLVDNARVHAGRRVAVTVRPEDGWAVIEVADDGPGVAPADRSAIFDRFVRADTARAREHGGAGLGLAIVTGIAHQHGGRVRCADPDALPGARFVVELPIAAEGAP